MAGALLLCGLGCAGAAGPGPFSPPRFVLLPEIECYEARALVLAIQKGRWDRAVERAGRVLEVEGLVPATVRDLSEKPDLDQHFVTPHEFLLRTLSAAPPEFRDAFRRRHDGAALRERARGLTREAWELYWLCTGMDLAGDRLASELYDSGCSGEAYEIWRAILLYLPEGPVPREVLAARMMLALAACGETDRLAEVPLPGGTVRAKGETVALDALRERLRWTQEGETPAIVTTTMAVRTFGSEGRVTLATDRGEVLLFTVHSGPLVLWKTLLQVSSRHRLLWTAGGLAGVVDLTGPRQVWMGPLREAPVPAHWVESALAMEPPPVVDPADLERPYDNGLDFPALANSFGGLLLEPRPVVLWIR